MSNPSLTEQGVKYWLDQTLKQTNTNKKHSFSKRLNMYSCIFFIVLFTFLFWNRKSSSLTPAQLNAKKQRDREYILSKLQSYAAARHDNGLITNLPLL